MSLRVDDVEPGDKLVIRHVRCTMLVQQTNPKTGKRFAVGDVVLVKRMYNFLYCVELEGVKGLFDLRAFEKVLTLLDVAIQRELVFAYPACTALSECINPKTGKRFAVGDLVEVTGAGLEGSWEFVCLKGMDEVAFSLSAFELPTSYLNPCTAECDKGYESDKGSELSWKCSHGRRHMAVSTLVNPVSVPTFIATDLDRETTKAVEKAFEDVFCARPLGVEVKPEPCGLCAKPIDAELATKVASYGWRFELACAACHRVIMKPEHPASKPAEKFRLCLLCCRSVPEASVRVNIVGRDVCADEDGCRIFRETGRESMAKAMCGICRRELPVEMLTSAADWFGSLICINAKGCRNGTRRA